MKTIIEYINESVKPDNNIAEELIDFLSYISDKKPSDKNIEEYLKGCDEETVRHLALTDSKWYDGTQSTNNIIKHIVDNINSLKQFASLSKSGLIKWANRITKNLKYKNLFLNKYV